MSSLAFAREKDPVFYDDHYAQIIIWPRTDVKLDEVDDFIVSIQEKFSLSYPVKFIGIVETSVGRHDLAFFVHRNDAHIFVQKKREHHMVWIDESYNSGNVYPKWFTEKYPGNRIYSRLS